MKDRTTYIKEDGLIQYDRTLKQKRVLGSTLEGSQKKIFQTLSPFGPVSIPHCTLTQLLI